MMHSVSSFSRASIAVSSLACSSSTLDPLAPKTRQSGDTSDGLEIAGPDALELNGSTIQRVSTYPSQAANVTFITGGGDGSDESAGGTLGLSGFSLLGDDGFSPVVLDCSEAPIVENVTSTAFAGEYGAGQRIYFQV